MRRSKRYGLALQFPLAFLHDPQKGLDGSTGGRRTRTGSPRWGLVIEGILDFFFQRVVLALDPAVNLGHLTTPFDDGLPELLALAPFEPVLQKLRDDRTALARAHGPLELLQDAGRKDVCSLDESHCMASSADAPTRRSYDRQDEPSPLIVALTLRLGRLPHAEREGYDFRLLRHPPGILLAHQGREPLPDFVGQSDIRWQQS